VGYDALASPGLCPGGLSAILIGWGWTTGAGKIAKIAGGAIAFFFFTLVLVYHPQWKQ
jgi:hypothetical protein